MSKTKPITTDQPRPSFWQNFFGVANKSSTAVALPAPALKFSGNSTKHNYDASDYDEKQFPYQAQIVEGGYEDNWREELAGIDAGEWSYETHKDIMRKRVVYVAAKTSLNAVQIEDPENPPATLDVVIKQASDRPPFITLKVEGSHIVRSNYRGDLQIRFDDNEPIGCELEKSNGYLTIDTVHIYKDAELLVAQIKNAKYMLIELCFYKVYGKNKRDHHEVFVVDVSDLEWEHEIRRLAIPDSSILDVTADTNTDVPADDDADAYEDDIADIGDFEEPDLGDDLEEPVVYVFAEDRVIDPADAGENNAAGDVQPQASDDDKGMQM